MKYQVLVDFDGTIATVDTTDLLLERFADPRWQEIEDDWKAGKMGSRECMLRQVDLVRATPAEIDDFVARIEIDPAFPDFVELCRQRGFDISVVSDGLDRTVGAVLARHDLELPFFANHMEWMGGDRWRLGFPHARGDCRMLQGNCKCQFTKVAPQTLRIVVGDGRSDFCFAGEAELVLAKGTLARHAAESGMPHFAIESFAEAVPLLAAWHDECMRVSPGGHDQLRDE